MMQQLYIDGQLADISESTEVTLKHESNFLKGAASFTSNHSLTVSLPATVHNRSIFGFPEIVQDTNGKAYELHTAEYHRNGVPVITDGQCMLLKVTPESIEVAIMWGMKKVMDDLFEGDMTLADITTNASIEFHLTPQVTPYSTAISGGTEVFYAAMDTKRYLNELEYYHIHVAFQNRSWDTNSLLGASSLLHPSVRMDWLLAKIEAATGVTLDFDDPDNDIESMIVPLISKIPNDITFNGGYKASASEPTTWGGLTGNFIRFTTSNPSPIIAAQSTPPEGSLVCSTAFSGLLRFSIYMYIDDLVLIGYPIYRAKYGYRLDISVSGATQSCIIIPEGTTFMAQERDANGRIGFTISGSIPVNMEINDTLTMRLTCINGGIADINLSGGIHVNGGTVWVNDIIGTVNEVQPTQQYPVQGNLPKIKVVDLIKFLCAVTGAFPTQAATGDTIFFRQMELVFDWSRAVDWSDQLLSPTDMMIAAQTQYTPDGWARENWWKWKDDETVEGDYNGGIEVDDETVEETRDIMVFPFAATDGNNVPMYTSTNTYDTDTQTWITEIKWNKVEPRVLHMQADSNGDAEAYFGFDMSLIVSKYYYDFAATMKKPVVITERFVMSDLQFMALDETKPIFLRQHGAYFALLSCELYADGTAKATLLKLKKQEER